MRNTSICMGVVCCDSLILFIDLDVCIFHLLCSVTTLCNAFQIALGLLNARVSTKSFKQWSGPLFRPLISLLLSKFSLIAPLVCAPLLLTELILLLLFCRLSCYASQSTLQAIRFQLLEASPSTINFSGDLKYGMLTNYVLEYLSSTLF